jgi:hypothetical protein
MNGYLKVTVTAFSAVMVIYFIVCAFLLVLHQPPIIGVKGALGDIAEYPDLLIVIAAPHDPSGPLLQISGAPRTVKVMGGHQTLL